MNKSLTPRQAEVLKYIVQQIQLKGYPPSVREIGFAIGIKSSATVHGHLEKLEEKGFIRKDPTKSRSIEILNAGEFLAKVDKGVPVPVIKIFRNGENVFHHIHEYYLLSEQFISTDIVDSLFLVQVSGNDMQSFGILDGDYVLVRQQQVALEGELILTLSKENKPQIQRFFASNGLTQNSDSKDKFKHLYIFGKVLGVHRKIE